MRAIRSTSRRRSTTTGRPTSRTRVRDRSQLRPRADPGRRWTPRGQMRMHPLLLLRRLLRILGSAAAGTHGHGVPLINAAAAGTRDAAADAAGSQEAETMASDRGAAACQRQMIMLAVTVRSLCAGADRWQKRSLHKPCQGCLLARPQRCSLRLGLPLITHRRFQETTSERWRQARGHYRFVLAHVVQQMRVQRQFPWDAKDAFADCASGHLNATGWRSRVKIGASTAHGESIAVKCGTAAIQGIDCQEVRKRGHPHQRGDRSGALGGEWTAHRICGGAHWDVCEVRPAG